MLIPLKISVNLRIEGIMVGIYHCTCKCSNASMHVHACRNVVSNSWGNFDQFVCQLTIDINGIVIKDTVHVLSLILEIFFSAGEVDCGGFEGDCEEREDHRLRYQESRPD